MARRRTDDVGDDSVLDALDEYIPADEPDHAADPVGYTGTVKRDADTVSTVLFTATNPDGTVSVTALMGGQILRVDLSPQMTTMTESELAEEITVIASLARRQAQAGQHVLIALIMRIRSTTPRRRRVSWSATSDCHRRAPWMPSVRHLRGPLRRPRVA